MIVPPSNIGTYSILSLLGSGGMGKIYLAQEPSGRKVALKVLLPELTAETLDRLRFEREFDIASHFNHPNLVKVYERNCDDDLCYYSMEFVDGSDLASRFRLEGAQQPSRQTSLLLLQLFTQLAEALQYLHTHQVIHRDLKCENVMVDRQERLRLLDFGLACFKRFNNSEDARLTSPGMVLGTPYSMAPEQILGDPADERSDLYSLGVMLYQVFCQRLPFEAADPMAVLYQILHEPVPDFVSRFPVPRGLNELVLQLLSKQPQERPRDAAEVKARLELLAERWDGAWEIPGPTVLAPKPVTQLSAPRFIARPEVETWFEDRLQACCQNRGSWALLTGPAGVGKSFLLQHWAGVAKAHGATALRVHPVSGSAIPYQLWTPVLRWALHLGVVPASVQPFVPALSVLLPELQQEGDREVSWEDPMARYHLFEGMARLILHRGQLEGKACVLFMDQVSEADAASLEFLQYFLETRYYGEEGLNLPLLVLSGGEEDEALKPLLRLIDQQAIGHHLVLGSFTLEQARQFLESLLDQQAVDPETVRFLVQETEGKPAYLQEVAGLAVERKAWHWREGSWHYQHPASSSAGGSLQFSSRLERAIQSRLDRLDETGREVLRWAAVLGPLLSFKHLQALCGLVDRVLYSVCTQLVKQRLLVERKDFELASRTTADVVLESMSWNERRGYHARLAEYLGSWAKPPHWEIARHWSLAGEPEQAGKAYLVQGKEALRSCGYDEACRCLEEIEGLPPLSRPLPPAELEEMWADALLGAAEPAPALEKLQRLVSNEEVGVVHVRRLRKLGNAYEMLGQLRDAHRCYSEGLQRLGRLKLAGAESEEALSESYHLLERENRVLFLLRPPNWLRDMSSLTGAQIKLALRRSGPESRNQAWAQAFVSGGFWSMRKLHWNAGAKFGFRTAARQASRLPDSYTKAHIQRDVGFLLVMSGAVEEGARQLESSRDMSLRLGDLAGLARTYMQLHTLLFHQGYVGAAARQLEYALAQARRTQNRLEEGIALAHSAKCLAVMGELGEAQHLLGLLQARRELFHAAYLERVANQAEAYYLQAAGDWGPLAALAGKSYEACKQEQELPFFTLHFGLLALNGALNLHNGPTLNKRAAELLEELGSSTRRNVLFRPIFKRLQARAFMLLGQRNKAFEILGECTRRAELAANPYESFLCHTLLADWLAEEGLEEHHRAQARLAFQQVRCADGPTSTPGG